MIKKLGPDHSGFVRKTQVCLGGNTESGFWVKIKEFPDWQRLPGLLDYWFKTHTQADTEDKIKEAHIAFEGIHPFVDGNGRTGRMIMNYQRVKHGFPKVCILCSERSNYYRWFEGR